MINRCLMKVKTSSWPSGCPLKLISFQGWSLLWLLKKYRHTTLYFTLHDLVKSPNQQLSHIKYDCNECCEVAQRRICQSDINQIIGPCVLPLLKAIPGTMFFQDGARLYKPGWLLSTWPTATYRVWPSKRPGLKSIEHMWDALDNKDLIRTLHRMKRGWTFQSTGFSAWYRQWDNYLASIATRGGHTRYWNVNLLNSDH